MTPDLDSLLRAADPAGRTPDDAALLARVRDRVDVERAGSLPAGHRRSPWPRRVTLIAAAAAVLTAVPLVISAVQDDGGGAPALVSPAVAADGSISCADGYASVVRPEEAEVRLLPDELPSGWAYRSIMVRHNSRASTCIPPSLAVVEQDAAGVVTARLAVTGPVDARIDRLHLVDESEPDTVLGHPALRFDVQASTTGLRRWVWTDGQGQQWSVEADGMTLEAARQALTAVRVDGPQVGWDPTLSPGWVVVHQRAGAPYATPQHVTTWWTELTDGEITRVLDVEVFGPVQLPLAVGADVGDRLTTLAGRPAIIARPQGGEADGGPPGSTPRTFVLVEPTAGALALVAPPDDERSGFEQMLASLRQVPSDDPRLARYGTD
ncbi:hypothetical protein [uncultured Modestobacter sp.]|uniref:hypothetical protein n=1 Tax=uncultured Modestobacter sp. TaxID=380048 RepID=UPI00261FE53B|nr:hypothetical protein [uncultured Modestobacter sp.]